MITYHDLLPYHAYIEKEALLINKGIIQEQLKDESREIFDFYGANPLTNPDKYWLSQWYKLSFKYEFAVGGSIVFPTAEHWMMYHKALLFDSDRCIDILKQTHPREAKRIGRQLSNFDAEKWEDAKVQIVIKGNLIKFMDNPEYAKKLISTGDSILVEASPRDRIWGIGMNSDQLHKTPIKDWKGLNLLGYSLMGVRNILNIMRNSNFNVNDK